MMNLFSIFDPSSWFAISLNWMSLLFVSFLISYSYWTLTPKKIHLMLIFSSYLAKEMKMLLKNKIGTKTLIFIYLILFIMLNNFLGLYPYIFTYTSHMVLTLSMALPFWLTPVLYGWSTKTYQMLAHMVPVGTSTILMPFMTIIELVSLLIRPITLAIRLATNMIAGHLLLTLLSNQFYTNYSYSLKTSLLSPHLVLLLLESGVAIVQAYVFATLCVLYSGEVN